MKGCRANSLPKGAESIIFLDEDAAHDHGISCRVAAQLRHAGVRLAVVIAAGAATATTAAMSAAAIDDGGSKSSSDGPAALHQHEQDRLGRARVGERARDSASSEVTNVDNVGFLPFLLKISGFVG